MVLKKKKRSCINMGVGESVKLGFTKLIRRKLKKGVEEERERKEVSSAWNKTPRVNLGSHLEK